ncbi:MAG TPA: hypothetical protein VMT54_04815 [Candidatus Cybelea sp.]|nr:hypothetical protein [Candidatus Cybelea sp.]
MLRFKGRLAAALVAALATAPMALAQDQTPTTPSPDAAQQLAVEGLAKIMQALDLFVKSVPQYAPPEVLPNGDIIIRRLHPSPDAAPAHPKNPDDGSST